MEKLGRVDGKARGTIFQLFFPILYNSRTERAYADALSKAPGALLWLMFSSRKTGYDTIWAC